MGLLLYLLSLILQLFFVPIGVLFGLFKAFYDTHLIDGLKHANNKFKKMAVGADIFGNVYAEELFNSALIKKEATHKFGEYGMTISAVLGLNMLDGTLTAVGNAIVKILNTIEKDHCLKAAKKALLVRSNWE